MAFDQPTRNRLARFVGDARALLSEEFTRQLQHEYGLDPTTGHAVEMVKLTHLDDARRETARILRETLAHYMSGVAKPTAKARQDALAHRAYPRPAEISRDRPRYREQALALRAYGTAPRALREGSCANMLTSPVEPCTQTRVRRPHAARSSDTCETADETQQPWTCR